MVRRNSGFPLASKTLAVNDLKMLSSKDFRQKTVDIVSCPEPTQVIKSERIDIWILLVFELLLIRVTEKKKRKKEKEKPVCSPGDRIPRQRSEVYTASQCSLHNFRSIGLLKWLVK